MTLRHAALLALASLLAACPPGETPPSETDDDDGPTEPDPTPSEEPDPGLCTPVATLSCGDHWAGDSSDPASGATSTIDSWPDVVGNYSGPEVVFAFESGADQDVEFALYKPRPLHMDQDVFLIEGDAPCNRDNAIERGFNSVQFEAEAGQTWYLAVDGFGGDAGEFEVDLICDEPTVLPSCSGLAFFELVVTDGWGRPLDGVQGAQPAQLSQDGDFSQVFSAPDFLDADVQWTVVGPSMPSAEASGDARVAMSRDSRSLPGYDDLCAVTTFYVGLTHLWFSSEAPRPPRADASPELFLSGEEQWESVYDDLLQANESVNWATWWWASDLELVRPPEHPTMTEEEREPYTVLTVLDDLWGVPKRINVTNFCGEGCFDLFTWITADGPLEDRGEDPDDDWEVVMQSNETSIAPYEDFDAPEIVVDYGVRLKGWPEFTNRVFAPLGPEADEARGLALPIASYHQKLITIDTSAAYVGGMNTKGTDWDTLEHGVFEPRRMDFDSDLEDRAAVEAGEERSDLMPRKDYGVRVQGALVGDVDALLSQRWNQAIDDGVPLSEYAQPFAPALTPEGSGPGLLAQLQLTLPAPAPERSILEGLQRALRQAQDYIYIEDQYWRSPLLNEVILEVLLERPQVQLMVVTQAMSSADPAAYWTVQTDALYKDQVPDQYRTLQVNSFDIEFVDGLFGDYVQDHLWGMSLHSKLVIIDDVYLSVGSANRNNRGLLYEGEANIAVLDAAWVREQRVRIFANMLGPARSAGLETATASEVFEAFEEAAAWNEQATTWWADNGDDLSWDDAVEASSMTWPDGFLYPLDLDGGWFVEPGPDAF